MPAPPAGGGRRRRSPPPEDPAWHERQRRVELYRQRVEAGLGVFSDAPGRERSLDELLADERAERAGWAGVPVAGEERPSRVVRTRRPA
jgi:hypothetical protein